MSDDVSTCNICECTDYAENAWKPGRCNNCFHNHNQVAETQSTTTQESTTTTTTGNTNVSSRHSQRDSIHNNVGSTTPSQPNSFSSVSSRTLSESSDASVDDTPPPVPQRHSLIMGKNNSGGQLGSGNGSQVNNLSDRPKPPTPKRKPPPPPVPARLDSANQDQSVPKKTPPPIPSRDRIPSENSNSMENTVSTSEGDSAGVSSTSTTETSSSSSSMGVSMGGGSMMESSGDSGEQQPWEVTLTLDFEDETNGKRNRIAHEILTTEQSYVRSLHTIMEGFVKPLNAALESGKKIISRDDIYVIFGNIDNILGVNRLLLDGLLERIGNWTDDQCIADVFLEMTPFLKMYETE